MTNVEIRMTKEARMPNDEMPFVFFMLFGTRVVKLIPTAKGVAIVRHSLCLRHSDFDIRHSLIRLPENKGHAVRLHETFPFCAAQPHPGVRKRRYFGRCCLTQLL
ncbi:MAG: hypothetical protein WD030_09055, partial [Pirellulales bacterium]